MEILAIMIVLFLIGVLKRIFDPEGFKEAKKKIEADKIAEAENQKRWDDEREKEKIERKKQEELTNKMKYSSNYTHDNSHKNGLGMTDTEKEVFGNNPPW